MSEEKKSLSPRGSFFIGFVLGAGILLVALQVQTKRLNDELGRVRGEVEMLTKRSQNLQGELSAMKLKAEPVKPDAAAK